MGGVPASAQGNAARAKSGAGANAAVQSSSLSYKGTIQPFIEQHCVDCHGADTHKAGLRLDTLAPDFRDEKTGATWTHVFDKIISGEMPPKKRERPPQRDIYAVAQFLYTQLQAISLEQQQKKGRVTVRRLNGTEYENTLRDLLGTNVALKEMLPEDSTTAGFDNVSTGLDLSATHLLPDKNLRKDQETESCQCQRDDPAQERRSQDRYRHFGSFRPANN